MNANMRLDQLARQVREGQDGAAERLRGTLSPRLFQIVRHALADSGDKGRLGRLVHAAASSDGSPRAPALSSLDTAAREISRRLLDRLVEGLSATDRPCEQPAETMIG